ncbi:hypothetical protein D3C73_1616150 [compost metagenome]
MLADQIMDPLCQILNTHIAIEIRIFSIQIWQHILHTQIQIVRTFELCQPTQQPHRPGFINANAEQK